MHNLLIAVIFLAIVLSPCAAALWTRTDSSMKKPVVQKTARPVERIADEMDDPWTAAESRRKTVLLKCVRASQARPVRLHEVHAVAASGIRQRRKTDFVRTEFPFA